MMLANLLLIIWDADKIKPLFLKDNQEYVLSNYKYPTAGKHWIIAGCILYTANLIAALISRYVPDHFIFIWAVSLIVSTSYVMILTTSELLYFRRASK
jgi:short subunit fatty acids transporter